MFQTFSEAPLDPEGQGSWAGGGRPHHRGGVSGWSPDFAPGDEELLQEALFDAVVTAPMEAYWTALALNSSE